MKILTYDHGLCLEAALALSRAGHSVGYYVPNDDAFPKPTKACIGSGFPNMERVADRDWDEAFARADAVFAPDTRSKKIVDQCIRERKPYWGAGASERMELDRAWMKEQQRKLGLQVGPYRTIVGIEKLIEHLKTAKDVWVKVSSGDYRGVIETFHHDNWNGTEAQVLGQLLLDFGADADSITFLVEEPLKGAEIGSDCFWVRGHRYGHAYGYEAKDAAYVGRDHGTLPGPLTEVDNALRQHPVADSAITFCSTEVLYDGKRAVLIDPTLRAPHPPMAGLLAMYPGFPLFVERAMNDSALPYLTPVAPYVAVLVVRSEWSEDHWTEIEFPERLRRSIFLSWACCKNGHYYILPGNTFVAYAVGTGATVQAAATAAKRVASEIHCREMTIQPDKLDLLIEKTIPEGRNLGLPF